MVAATARATPTGPYCAEVESDMARMEERQWEESDSARLVYIAAVLLLIFKPNPTSHKLIWEGTVRHRTAQQTTTVGYEWTLQTLWRDGS